jgi:hypothetical protein
MVLQFKMVYLTFLSALVSHHLPVNVVAQVKSSFHPDFAVEGTSCKKSVTLCCQKLTVVTHTV